MENCHSKINPSCARCQERSKQVFRPIQEQYRVDFEQRERRWMERYDPEWEVANIALIGLPRTLRQGPAKARDICNGMVFRAVYEQCMSHGDDVWILSPAHGLLEPEAIIAGDGLCLEEMGFEARFDWACDVVGDLISFYSTQELNVVLYASSSYDRAFQRVLKMDELTWKWRTPDGWNNMTVPEKIQLMRALEQRD